MGEHATEQRFFAYQWRINEQMGYNQKLSTNVRQLVTGLQYLVTRKGVIGTGEYDLAALAKSKPSLATPDLFLMFSPYAIDFSAEGYAIHADPGITGTGYLVAQTTESSIHATSLDPFAPPIIDVRYLEETVGARVTAPWPGDRPRNRREASPGRSHHRGGTSRPERGAPRT